MLHNMRHHLGSDHDKAKPSFPGSASDESKVPKRRPSGLRFFASSSAQAAEPPSNDHKTWESQYLNDLRSNRPARPGGSRPLPACDMPTKSNPYTRASSAMSFRPATSTQPVDPVSEHVPERSTSALSNRLKPSDKYGDLGTSNIDNVTITQQRSTSASRDFSANTNSSRSIIAAPGGIYRENGMRWMERQEAKSLREALEDMDLRREATLHANAQDEATRLVSQHRESNIQHRRPSGLRNYREHLKEGAHARSQSQIFSPTAIGYDDQYVAKQRSSSNSSGTGTGGKKSASDFQDTGNPPQNATSNMKSHALWDSPARKAYMDMALPGTISKFSGRRRTSGPRARDFSNSLFRNPNDKIYEEPNIATKEIRWADSTEEDVGLPLAAKPPNTHIMENPPAPEPDDVFKRESQLLYRSEIHRNPPSKSRNPQYLQNDVPANVEDHVPADDNVQLTSSRVNKAGLEIRGDDIKAATSRLFRDRSPKLPSPSAVSDRPTRPIVSFDKQWKPKEGDQSKAYTSASPKTCHARPHSSLPLLESTASAPVIPTIIEPGSAPLPDPSPTDIPCIPSISLPDDAAPTRPLPDLSNACRHTPASRPLPNHSSTAPARTSTPHWSASAHRPTAQCAACALPIAGRIVSAASQRFHPHCFTCHHCACALECVAFYPEPDDKRIQRLARIERRAKEQHSIFDKQDTTANDDGDESLRFYCHLDFHEIFSPRCRSCKTPIETEVVIACGGTWHVGHFFCAECGDPFDAETPFVEKDGYAWCVKCHAGRFSGKCKGCRKPVVTEGITALDAEWHAQCFVCTECNGAFEDGKFFTRESDDRPICMGCEQRRLKA